MASSENLGLAFLGAREAAPAAPLSAASAPAASSEPAGYITGVPPKKGEKAMPRTQVSYLLPFEIVSVHLLVVLIAAAYLARAKRRRGGSS